MAKGLRKLIKQANRFSTTSTLARRLKRKRFGPRLRVEELEDRIAPATLGANDYLIYDTAEGPAILWNNGATAVEVTVTDGGGATDLDTMTITCNVAGAVSLYASGPLAGTGGVLIADSAAVSLSLETGDETTDLPTDAANATYWAGSKDATLDAATDPAESGNAFDGTASDADVTPIGSDVTGSITLDNTGSSVTSINIQAEVGTSNDTGAFTGALTVDDNVVAVNVEGTATGAWDVGGDVTGNITLGATAATTDIAITGDLGDGGADVFTVTNAIAGDIIVTGDIISAITGGTGISGAISAGDILDNIVATTGNISGNISTTAAGSTGNGEITGNITATAGIISGTITAVGDISGNITADDDITGAITADTIAGNITATTGDITALISTTGAGTYGTGTGAIANIEATAGAITGGITTTDGDVATDLANVASITAGNGITTTGIDIDGDLTNLDVTGNVTSNIDADGTIGDIDISGTLDSTITATDGYADGVDRTIDGGISGTGSLVATTGGFVDAAMNNTLTIGGVGIQGSILATAGDIENVITITDGGLAGSITATANAITGTINIQDSDADDDGTLTGLITAPDATNGDVAIVNIADGILATGAIIAGDDITGLITITEGGLALGGTSTTGIIRAGDDITGGVTIVDGGLAGTIKAVTGNISGVAITVTDGGIASTGVIEAGTDISAAVTVSDDGVAGQIKADNDVSGLISVTDGIAATAVIQAGNDLGAGGIAVATGDITAGATVQATNDITGAITVAQGDIDADITAGNSITNNIQATLGAITGTVKATAGDLSGDVKALGGSIANIIVGGDIDTSTIQAEDDITVITVTGGIIGPSTITASFNDVDSSGNIGTITAGDGISATIAAININTITSGGLVGDDIDGTITATGDIDLINAGAGTINATVTANVATSASPLATFISGGYSFAVWAITPPVPAAPTEPTVDAGVTAELIFDGTGTPTLEINNLADSSPASTPDIYVTSRADTGTEQLFHDPNVTVYDAPITLTQLSAAAAITVGTIYIEGSFTDIGGDSDITFTSVVVEGGAGGTISVAVGADIEFGWVEDDLNINVVGGGKAGDLILKSSGAPGSGAGYAVKAGASIIVDGSLTDIYLGDSSAGFVGDLGEANSASALIDTLTNGGSIDDIFIDGSVYGNIRATQIGDIEVDGSIGSNIAANIDITGRDGIGDIKVDGSIGGDAAGQSVTIQATAATANIGEVNAVGGIGESAAAGTVVTIAAGNNIGKVESTDDIGDADSLVVISAANGTIGSVMAGGSYGIAATITAGGNIGTVKATDPDDTEGIIRGTILSHEGDISAVNTYEATISATITATLGDVTEVAVLNDVSDADFESDTGDVSGNITAGGNIDLVMGAEITGTIIAGAATAASPVTQFVIGNYNSTGVSVLFELNATSGALYGYTLTYSTVTDAATIDITVDNWDGAAARATGDIDVSLTTTRIDDSASGQPYPAFFNLNSLDFTPASIANTFDTLGTVTVEGNVNVLDTGTMMALIAEGNVQGPIVIEDHATQGLTAFAAATVTGVDDPTLAQMEAVFEDLLGGPISFAAPADPTIFTVPVSSLGGDVSFAFGTATGLAGEDGDPLLLGSGTVESFLVTVSGGEVSNIEATVNDTATVIIEGDLDHALVAETLTSVWVQGNITAAGSIFANNITGAITVGWTVGNYIAVNGDFADTAAAQAWLDANGNMAGTITSQETVQEGAVVLAGGIGSIAILGDYTGDIIADGNVGAIAIGQSYDDVDGTKLAQTGDMTGTLFVGGNLTSLTAELDIVDAVDSYIAVVGNSGTIQSLEGSIGGSGLIMVGGSLVAVTALNGMIDADIMTGGLAGSTVTLTAQGIGGDLALGVSAGIERLTLSILETSTDANPDDYVITCDGSENDAEAMIVEIADGNITATGVTVDRITMLTDAATNDEVTLTANDENNIDLTELVILIEQDTLTVTVPGDLGTVIASNDIDTAATNTAGKTSDQIQSIFLSNYNTAESTAISLDVIDNGNPTLLDSLLNNTGNIDLDLELVADALTGGVIASGDILIGDDAVVDVISFGYICSLNGSVEAYIYANESIGDIAASDDIYVELDTEGVVAVGDGSDMQDAVDLYGLDGLPAWFAGGILSEIGDIEIYITADGEQTLVAGIPMSSSDLVLGTIYAMLGTVDGTITLVGDFGGIIAPLETSLAGVTLNMPNYSQIGMFVAPNANGADPNGNHPSAQLELLNGEILVSMNNPYVSGYDTITVDGAGTLVYLTTDGDVYVLTGLNDAAASVTIEGDINDLYVETDWDGDISVLENADGDEGEIGWLTVNGDIDQSTANLEAFNFSGYTHNGDVTGISPVDAYQFVEEGTLDSSHRSIAWENLAGEDQTLYVNASRAMNARYTTFFGKLDVVEITGQGNADVVSVNGDYDACDRADLRALTSMARQAVQPGHDIFDSHGTAQLGALVTNRGWGRATLRNVVIDGYNEVVNVDGSVKGLRITGDSDWIGVSRSISNAFINTHLDLGYIQSDSMNNVTIFGDVDEFDAIKANKVYITGDVDDQMSGQNWNRVAVDGSVHELWMFAGTAGGRLLNCRFSEGVSHENIDNRKYIPFTDSVDAGDGGDGGDGGAGDGAVGGDGGNGGNGAIWGTDKVFNLMWNPVKVIRTIAPGLNPWSSDEYPDD